MSFENIQKGKWVRREPVLNRVSMTASMTISSFSISGDIYAKMGAPTFVRIALGSSEHAGMMLVRPTGSPTDAYRVSYVGGDKVKNAARAARGTGHGLRKFAMSTKKTGIPKGFETATLVLKHELTEDGLVIWLPKANDAIPLGSRAKAIVAA